MTTVIGIDPGKKTGMFVCSPHWMIEHHESEIIRAGEQLAAWLRMVAGWGDDALVVYERFIVSPGGGARTMQLDALEMIGIAKYVCSLTGQELTAVAKSDALKLASNDRLRQAGWWGRGYTHANDAARVAMAAYAPRHPEWFADIIRKGA